mmetsp:Transcript_8525/g.53277  ORF Transcript_8525/g.53277 Transcript_8525/m.53277 type:complete len:242 (+) Transcript_8525:2716-3441(+)
MDVAIATTAWMVPSHPLRPGPWKRNRLQGPWTVTVQAGDEDEIQCPCHVQAIRGAWTANGTRIRGCRLCPSSRKAWAPQWSLARRPRKDSRSVLPVSRRTRPHPSRPHPRVYLACPCSCSSSPAWSACILQTSPMLVKASHPVCKNTGACHVPVRFAYQTSEPVPCRTRLAFARLRKESQAAATCQAGTEAAGQTEPARIGWPWIPWCADSRSSGPRAACWCVPLCPRMYRSRIPSHSTCP